MGTCAKRASALAARRKEAMPGNVMGEAGKGERVCVLRSANAWRQSRADKPLAITGRMQYDGRGRRRVQRHCRAFLFSPQKGCCVLHPCMGLNDAWGDDACDVIPCKLRLPGLSWVELCPVLQG